MTKQQKGFGKKNFVKELLKKFKTNQNESQLKYI